MTEPEIIRNHTILHLDWLDRFRALCGKTIHVEIEIHAAQPEVTITSTDSRCWVEHIIPARKKGGYAIESTEMSGDKKEAERG